MKCPFCNFENIDGVDQCGGCHAALTGLGDSEDPSSIEYDLLHQPVGTLMDQDFVTAGPDAPVREVISRLNQQKHHCAIVVEAGRIVGIFTERDVLNKLADRFEALADEPVRRYMTPDPAMLPANAPVAFCLNWMMVGGYRHIPIERDGELAGVVSVRDILAYLTQRYPDLAKADVKA